MEYAKFHFKCIVWKILYITLNILSHSVLYHVFNKSIALSFSYIEWFLQPWAWVNCEYWILSSELIVLQFEQFLTQCFMLLPFSHNISIWQRIMYWVTSIRTFFGHKWNSSCLIHNFFGYSSIALYSSAIDLAFQSVILYVVCQ